MNSSRSTRAAFVALGWAASIVGTVLLAQDTPAPERPRETRPFTQPRSGPVMSGDNVGVRVTGEANGVVYGVLVVRVNGQWVEVAGVPRLTPAR
jgi:hypothetical protein